MPKVNSKTRQPKAVSGQGYCRKCQKTKSLNNNFYEATNPFLDTSNYMSICRNCCNDIYNHYFSIYGNMKDAIHATCQDLDIRFSEQVLEQTQSHIEKLLSRGKTTNAVFGYYKSKLMSTGKNNERIDSFRYKDSDCNYLENNYSNDNKSEKSTNKELNKGLKNSFDKETIKFWGKGKELWEYEYLEEEKFKIKTSFECPDYGMEMIMRDICFINLDIEKIRLSGKDARGDISKLIETRSKLMNDAKMKPIQSTGAEANDQITFGTLIKKLENERPTDEPLDEWKDPDNFEKWHKIFVGHLADMNDIDNDVVREYKEIVKPYTISREDSGD